jgi:hypothetical protein
MGHAKERKQFFFEKQNQKTFGCWHPSAGEVRDSDSKVFCFFFSKKKFFLSFSSRLIDPE